MSRAKNTAPPAKKQAEADLYGPVKAFLEAEGYVVKGEIEDCDIVACRGAEPPIIVELKLRFNLALVLQGVRRLGLTDRVFLAVPRRVAARRESVSPDDRDVRKLCRMLGLGLLTVNRDAPPGRAVEIVLEPEPYRPRKNKKVLAKLLREHRRRIGDPNLGGVRRTPIVTAYRQEALRCAQLLAEGPVRLASLRATGLVPHAASILQQNVYGWFQREGRGVYGLGDLGRQALLTFAHALDVSPTALVLAESATSEHRMIGRVNSSATNFYTLPVEGKGSIK